MYISINVVPVICVVGRNIYIHTHTHAYINYLHIFTVGRMKILLPKKKNESLLLMILEERSLMLVGVEMIKK